MTKNESYKLHGIILKRTNYKDADKIITLITAELGKITCLAKGIRKIESKNKSHLELMNKIEFYAIKIGDWHLITQAKSINTYPNLKKDFFNINYSMAIIELSNKLLNDNEKDIAFYDLISNALYLMNKNPNIRILINFIFNALIISGIYDKEKFYQLAKYNLSVAYSEIRTRISEYESTSIEMMKITTSGVDIKLEIDLAILKTLLLFLEYEVEIKLKTPVLDH